MVGKTKSRKPQQKEVRQPDKDAILAKALKRVCRHFGYEYKLSSKFRDGTRVDVVLLRSDGIAQTPDFDSYSGPPSLTINWSGKRIKTRSFLPELKPFFVDSLLRHLRRGGVYKRPTPEQILGLGVHWGKTSWDCYPDYFEAEMEFQTQAWSIAMNGRGFDALVPDINRDYSRDPDVSLELCGADDTRLVYLLKTHGAKRKIVGGGVLDIVDEGKCNARIRLGLIIVDEEDPVSRKLERFASKLKERLSTYGLIKSEQEEKKAEIVTERQETGSRMDKPIDRAEHVVASEERKGDRSEPPPWEQIPEKGWDRSAVQLLWDDLKINAIAQELGKEEKTVRNRLSQLRREHGANIVPTREQLGRTIMSRGRRQKS